MSKQQAITRSAVKQDFALPRWTRRPLARCWKPLLWLWGALLIGAFINLLSVWLIRNIWHRGKNQVKKSKKLFWNARQ